MSFFTVPEPDPQIGYKDLSKIAPKADFVSGTLTPANQEEAQKASFAAAAGITTGIINVADILGINLSELGPKLIASLFSGNRGDKKRRLATIESMGAFAILDATKALEAAKGLAPELAVVLLERELTTMTQKMALLVREADLDGSSTG